MIILSEYELRHLEVSSKIIGMEDRNKEVIKP